MNRKQILSRWLKRKRRPADRGAASRFLDQFDTKLRFRELEPRVVLAADANVVGNVLEITTDAADDQVTVEYYDNSGTTYFEVRDQDNNKLADGLAGDFDSIKMTDEMGVHDNQSLTLLDNSTLIDPNLTGGLITTGIETVTFQGSNAGDSWTFGTGVNIQADTFDAVVNQSGADLLTPMGTPVDFSAINGASIDVDLQSTGNEISLLSVDQGGDVKVATSVDLDVKGSNADLLQVVAPNVKLGSDGLDSEFGALKIDLAAAGDITQVGKLTVTGTTDLNVDAGNVLLNVSTNDFQDAVSVNATGGVDATDAKISDANDLVLGDIRTTSLTAVTGGDLTQSLGTSVQVSDTVDFQFTTAGKNLDLQNAGNVLPTADGKFLLGGPETPLNFYLRNDTTANAIPLAIRTLAGSGTLNDLTLIYTQNASPILLPTIDITGDLDYRANGKIEQDGGTTILVDGHASFTTLTSQDILLSNAGNDFVAISAIGATTAGNVVIDDDNGDVSLDQIDATTLNVNAAGAIFNETNASVQVSGNANLIAGGQIDVGNQMGDDVRFGSLTFTSGSNVAIRENDATNLVGVSSAVSLYLESADALTNDANAKLSVVGDASFAGTSIDLGNASGDEMKFGALIFNSAGAVAISEDDATDLNGMSQADTLVLKSLGAITNQANAELDVTGNASFSGTSIVLGNQAGDLLTFGRLTFNSAGSVSIAEDEATELSGTSQADSLVLSSTGAITNAASAEVNVTGNASFSGTSVTLGDQTDDVMTFGSLTFNSVGTVSIAEDDGTELSGVSQANTLILSSLGAITNATNAKVDVTNNASFSGTTITLGDQAGDLLTFGSLTFNSAGAVSIAEDDATHLSATSQAASLVLSSTGAITNAANAEVDVTGNASFSGTAVTLGNQTDDLLTFGSLTFNSAGAVSIAEDDATELSGISQADTLVLSSTGAITNAAGAEVDVTNNASFSGTAITLGDQAGDLLTLGSLTFVSAGAVSIAEDDATELSGISQADSLVLSSLGPITSVASTELNVTNNASFSGTTITLGDQASDVMAFGSLTFNSAGAVVIYEDDATELSGVSKAGSLELKSLGAITNVANVELEVTGNASFSGTSVTLGDQTDDVMTFGSLTFNSIGTVSIAEDDATELSGVSQASTLILSSLGAITNATNAKVDVTNNASFSGTTITLGDHVGDLFTFGTLTFKSAGAVSIAEDNATELSGASQADSLVLSSTGAVANAANAELNVTGNASFSGTSVTLGDQTDDVMTFGSLTFSSTGAVSIAEDDATELSGISQADTLVLSSTGAIANAANAELNVTKNASFSGTSITLGDQMGDSITLGALTFNSAGAVSIAEDDATELSGISQADSLVLNSLGAITNVANAEVNVTNNASFSGTSVTLGDQTDDVLAFGSLTFNSAGAVVIYEDDATVLAGMNTALSLDLSSTDSITDAAGTSVVVAGPATFTAVNEIILADDADTLHITGLATFESTADAAITVGGASSSTQFGSLTFNGGVVTIQEDDATVLTGANTATSLDLASAASITDLAMTTVTVTGAATFTAVNQITLADDDGSLHVGGLATFDSTGDDAILVGNLLTSTLFGSLNFNGGSVTIQENDAMVLTGTNTATSLNLASADTITDAAMTSVTVGGDALFTAANDIILADSTGDVLHVTGRASFASVAGAITVGGDGSSTQFGSLRFFGGEVTIQEDDSTVLSGVSTATTLDLISGGSIYDETAASLTVNGDATFTAQDEIELADEAGNSLQVLGLAKFVSLSGATIDVGVDNSVIRGTDSGATVNFGQLMFVSDDGAGVRGSVTIREDSSMELTGVNLAADLFLAADGSIIQVEDGDSLTADRIDLDVNGDGSVVGDAVFEAAAGAEINLFGDTSANPLGEPVSTFLADNKIANAEFRAAGGGSLSDVYYRNISTAALFPTLPSSITGDLRIQFTSADMIIDDDINVGEQLTLEALGTMAAISDVDGISIAAKDAIIVADGTIALADESLNSLIVGASADDNAFFYSRGGKAITIGASDAEGTASGATVELSSLTFYSGDGASARGDIVIHETDSTLLASRRFDVDGTPFVFINQADSLVLITDGDLTDADSDGSMGETILRASVDTANSSVMIAGGEIHLADQSQVAVDGVELGVYSLGLSDGAVDNDVALFATTSGGDIRVGVADALATDGGALVEVDGLTFNTAGGAGDVYLQIDSDTTIANRDFAGTTYENLADDLVLRTTGSIESTGDGKTTILGDARFLASEDVDLVNADPNGQLLVVGNAFFEAGGAITVGVDTAGVNFGTLTFNAPGAVEITESNAASGLAMPAAGMTLANTTFDGGSTNYAGSLTLRSDSFIEDAAGTTVEVDTQAAFLAATTITLADDAGDTLKVGTDAAFTSTGGQQIDVGVTPTTQLATDRGTDSGATVELGTLQINSVGGDVTVHEDLGMLLAGTNQAGTLVLVANQGDLRDQSGTSVTVTDFAEFHAENNVVLADQSDDLLSVAGNALFTSGNVNYFATPGASREISVGVVDVDAANNPNDASRGTDSGATVSLGSVTFFGFANMDDGAQVTIREDESMVLTHAERREGGGSTEIANFAQTAVLIADNVADDATIADQQIDGAGGTSIETTSYAVFQADSHIVLADEAADVLTIGDNAYFASQLGDVDLGVIAKAVNALDRGADSGASVQFGSLTFQAALGDVTIHEDDGTTLAIGNALRDTGGAANSLVLESGGEIDDAAGTNLVVAQLATPPVAGSAEDQVDGLAILRTASDVHLGDSVGDSIDFRRLSLSVGGDVSITETSATDGGLLLVDGSAAGGTLAVRTSGHLVQINDERTGAAFSMITADQALLIAGGGVVLTNVDFNQASLQAHGTLQVTPGATLNADDAANGGLLGRRTTDAISSYLPDSNDDTFAPKGPSTTSDTQTNMDGAYSIVLSDVDELTIGLVSDAKGTIAVDPVTLAFQVAETEDFATADFNPALSAVGVSAGHMFVQTAGDLTFAENAADPLDNVVVYGEVRMAGGTTTNNAFTALSGGTLNITGDSMLVMRSAADFYLFNPDNNTLTPFVGGGLADSIGSLGAVHTFATFVDVDTQPGFVQVGEFGPIYQRTAQSPDPDASTSQIAKALSNGQFQVNATITNLGDASTVEVDGQQVYVEQNFRVLVDWGDGTQSVYLFQDPIDGSQTLQHTYDSGFARTEQRATVTITAYNDPQINLYDNVVDDTTFRDLNSVTDTFEVIFPIGVQFAPEPPPFELPAAPEIAPVVLLPEVVFAVSTNSTYESDGGLLNQVQEVVVVIVNALDEEVGERIVLQGYSTIEEVKKFIQESTRFLPGRYKVSILLAGQQEPDVYFFEKIAAETPDGADSGASYDGGKQENFVRIDASHAAAESSPEQVWTAQYEQWFDTDEEATGDQAAEAVENWTPDLSAVLLREERAEEAAEQSSLRKRWMLPGGIGGALMMAAYALRPQADQERSEATDRALETPSESDADGDFRRARRRWRRRVR
ncbi:beta strand repeat-containing protein [Blastopirellula marina]|uniref:Uncharacterized protein n=1 Tax=Blastopirellula marina TaxID=124 RepID=A0A2S8GRX2_9BACT|nr:hypothetical protein [Blastopirellula marina]PQO47187.1 hypothetical protein C5Y93_03865 [Blastopirellula marina]